MTISKSFRGSKEKLAHLRALALLELPVDIDSVVVDVDMVNQGLDDGNLSLIIQRVDLSGRQGVFAEGFDPLGISTCFGVELSSEGIGLCFEFFPRDHGAYPRPTRRSRGRGQRVCLAGA